MQMTINNLQVNLMSTEQIISLAQDIVKATQNHQPIKTPHLEGWEFGELLWWMKNLGGDLV